MKATKSPFRPITLSPNDTTQLQVITKAILDANLDRYQHFASVDSCAVDPKTWKLVKTKENLSAFVQRQRRQASFPFQVNPTIESNALQSLLCVGSIPGTLEDVMTRVINSREDDLGQASFLSRVKIPTPTDQFKSMAVKWMELNVRFKSMGLVKSHDYVYVEASDILQLPNGARIGYHLLHSVDVPGVHTLKGRTRGKLSVCSFYRQLNKTTVSVYTLGLIDAMGERARRVIIPRFINALVSTKRNCSERKRVGQNCVVCSKRVVRLGKFWNGNNICSICSECVCNSCTNDKKVKFVAVDLKVTQKKRVLCSLCLRNPMATNVSELLSIEKSNYTSVWQSKSRITVSGIASSSVVV